MKIFSLLLNPALGASFAYGAYQTWIVLKNSMEARDNREARRMINDQRRILKFWVVMICMLTVTPFFDLIFGFIFGPLWSIIRMFIFWHVAYSKTLGSGWLFEQYELGAPFIEQYILEVIIIFRQGRTLALDYVYGAVLKAVDLMIKAFLTYASRAVLMTVRVKIKEAHWLLETEMKKQIRPGHRRKSSSSGKGNYSCNDAVQMSVIRKDSHNTENRKYMK